MSQARIKPEIFVNFSPEPDPKSPVRLTTMVLNVKDLVLSNYSKNARNVIQWHLNTYFFQKFTKSCPAVRGFAPTPPSVIRLSYTRLLTMSPKSHILTFKHLLQTLPGA